MPVYEDKKKLNNNKSNTNYIYRDTFNTNYDSTTFDILQKPSVNPELLSNDEILQLQQIIGNNAVEQLLTSNPQNNTNELNNTNKGATDYSINTKEDHEKLVNERIKGDDVALIQAYLAEKGLYSKKAIDGIYGEKTVIAVYKWQQNYNNTNTNDIIIDGMVGKQTWKAMGFAVQSNGQVDKTSKKYKSYLQLVQKYIYREVDYSTIINEEELQINSNTSLFNNLLVGIAVSILDNFVDENKELAKIATTAVVAIGSIVPILLKLLEIDEMESIHSDLMTFIEEGVTNSEEVLIELIEEKFVTDYEYYYLGRMITDFVITGVGIGLTVKGISEIIGGITLTGGTAVGAVGSGGAATAALIPAIAVSIEAVTVGVLETGLGLNLSVKALNNGFENNEKRKDARAEKKLTSAEEYAEKVSERTTVKGDYTDSALASDILREELKSAGVSTPPYKNAAHHIVPWNDSRALEARNILDDFGIDYNSAANGVFLPMEVNKYTGNSVLHVGNHGPEYFNTITDALEEVASRGGTKADIVAKLSELRKGLLNGTLKLN